jgi:hypothetical protein
MTLILAVWLFGPSAVVVGGAIILGLRDQRRRR